MTMLVDMVVAVFSDSPPSPPPSPPPPEALSILRR